MKRQVSITSETTISLALLSGIVATVFYVASIGKQSEANAGKVTQLEREQQFFRQKYIEHTRIMDENMTTIKTDLGEVKGMVKVILNSTED